MKYISVLGMRFKNRIQDSGFRIQEKTNLASCILYLVSFLLLLFTFHFSLLTAVHAEVLDRVVAIVDDEAVMLSEFNETFQKAISSGKEVTQDEVLDGLINRVLLLKQAKKFSIIEKDDNTLINEYIERRLKAFIRIPFDEVELFYIRNKESFGGKNFYDVRDEIEEYLIEEELNKKLIKHIEELRKNAYIKIQLEK